MMRKYQNTWHAGCLALSVSVWLLPAPALASSPSPLDEKFVSEFASMTLQAKPLGIEFDTRVVDQLPEGDSPVSMAYAEGRCTLILRTENNPETRRLLDLPDDLPLDVKIRAVLAHELGHCFSRYFAPTSEPMFGYREKRKRHQEEVRADQFALAWASICDPAEFESIKRYLVTLRRYHTVDDADNHATADEVEAGAHLPEHYLLRGRTDLQSVLSLVGIDRFRTGPQVNSSQATR